MSLLQMSFFGSIMILVIVVLRALLIHKIPKKTFLILWAVVLVRLLVPFSLPSAFSVYSVAGDNLPLQAVSELLVSEPMMNVTTMEVTDSISYLSVWQLVWGIGAICCAIFFLVNYWHCSFVFRTAVPVQNEYVHRWLGEHRSIRLVTIKQSDRIVAPLTYGILRPVILMPGKTDWKNATQLKYILLHEYVHIRRFDVVTKLLMVIALCIHWFNPFVWAMYFLLNRDIELSCDEMVVRQLGEESRALYSRTLIAMEARKSGLLPFCNSFSRNFIEERITAIMKTKKVTVGIMLLSVILVAVVVILFATSRKEAEFQQVPGTTSTNPTEQESYNSYEGVKRELQQIINSHDNILADYQVECEMVNDAIGNVNIILNCTEHISKEEEDAIREQLAESVGIAKDNIFIEWIEYAEITGGTPEEDMESQYAAYLSKQAALAIKSKYHVTDCEVDISYSNKEVTAATVSIFTESPDDRPMDKELLDALSIYMGVSAENISIEYN